MKKILYYLAPLFVVSLVYGWNVTQPYVNSTEPTFTDVTTTDDVVVGDDLTVTDDSNLVDIIMSGTIAATKINTAAGADGTNYFNFISSTVDPATSSETGSGIFQYNIHHNSNNTITANALEGVARSRGADEAATMRGVYGRFYIDPSVANSTLRTGVGVEASARASYSGGTLIAAESGTAFVGARIWMAPYFTATSTANINNFHGLWIYNEHTSMPITNAIKIGTAGGIWNNDINLQNGETINNLTNDSVKINDDDGNTAFEVETSSRVAYFQIPSRTEAQLQAMSCAEFGVGRMFVDSTNSQVLISTGTGVGAFGELADFAQPTGW